MVQNKVINPNTGKTYNITDIVTITQGLITAMMQLMNVMPNISNVARARVVGKKIFDILER